ncbi:hypothetical protein [Cryobacterium sp. Hh38]|uniref:hypothetical protein n=1 Tax=Cryobacterium sp. Hh38 TaxID=1259156 RepID=UPI00106BF326|nr:hypothetical protein [Cryobacterium sp. Hh38]TFD56395.1 hypothetical protein E3T41_14380 [Cryobacterium sp. Hh38]
MSYQTSLSKIRESTNAQVLEAWRVYGLGRITKAQFVQLAAALILQANGKAAALADLSLSAELYRLTGDTHAPLGVLPSGYDQPRLQRGVETLLVDFEAGEDIDARLTRFATNAPLGAATDAYSEGVKQSTAVEGYVRQMDSDPCQLCRYWWREGRIWPKDHRMPHHKGCACTHRVVTVDKIRSVSR